MTEEILEEWVEFVDWTKVPPHLLTKEVREKYKELKSMKMFSMLEGDLLKVCLESTEVYYINNETIPDGCYLETRYLIPIEEAGFAIEFVVEEATLQLKYYETFARYVRKVTNTSKEETSETIRRVLKRFSVPVKNIDNIKIVHAYWIDK